MQKNGQPWGNRRIYVPSNQHSESDLRDSKSPGRDARHGKSKKKGAPTVHSKSEAVRRQLASDLQNASSADASSRSELLLERDAFLSGPSSDTRYVRSDSDTTEPASGLDTTSSESSPDVSPCSSQTASPKKNSPQLEGQHGDRASRRRARRSSSEADVSKHAIASPALFGEKYMSGTFGTAQSPSISPKRKSKRKQVTTKPLEGSPHTMRSERKTKLPEVFYTKSDKAKTLIAKMKKNGKVPTLVFGGAGIAGVMMALYASKLGFKVELLDRNPDICQGATGCNPGRMGRGPHYDDDKTAKDYMRETFEFSEAFPGFHLGEDEPRDAPVNNGIYWLMKQNTPGVPASDITQKRFFEHLDNLQEYSNELIADAQRRGLNPEEFWGAKNEFYKKILPGSDEWLSFVNKVNLGWVQAGAKTNERLLDTKKFFKHLRSLIDADLNISFHPNTEVVGFERDGSYDAEKSSFNPRFKVETEGADPQKKKSFSADYYVNSSWHMRETLNELARVNVLKTDEEKKADVRSLRLKAILGGFLPEDSRLSGSNPHFFYRGAHLMITIMSKDEKGRTPFKMTVATETNVTDTQELHFFADPKFDNGQYPGKFYYNLLRVTNEHKKTEAHKEYEKQKRKRMVDIAKKYLPGLGSLDPESCFLNFEVVESQGESVNPYHSDSMGVHAREILGGFARKTIGFWDAAAMKLLSCLGLVNASKSAIAFDLWVTIEVEAVLAASSAFLKLKPSEQVLFRQHFEEYLFHRRLGIKQGFNFKRALMLFEALESFVVSASFKVSDSERIGFYNCQQVKTYIAKHPMGEPFDFQGPFESYFGKTERLPMVLSSPSLTTLGSRQFFSSRRMPPANHTGYFGDKIYVGMFILVVSSFYAETIGGALGELGHSVEEFAGEVRKQLNSCESGCNIRPGLLIAVLCVAALGGVLAQRLRRDHNSLKRDVEDDFLGEKDAALAGQQRDASVFNHQSAP